MNPTCSRRRFLRTALSAAAVPLFSARSWAQVAGANSDLRIGVAGLHGRGRELIKGFREVKGVRLVALCDVDSEVLQGALQSSRRAGEEPRIFGDPRRMLDQGEVDAIAIATPNHWHSLLSIWACQAGKDVYVEKPISHNLWEGRQLVAAAARYSRVVQAGMQSRSSVGIAQAVEWVRAGNLGRIVCARGLCYKRRESLGITQGPQPVPASVDYDVWCGPAPLDPPRRRRFHYDWHWFWPTGNGDLGNQGCHQMDIARWFLGEPHPAARILTVGGRFGYRDDGETPNTLVAALDYERAPLIFEVRGLPAHSGAPAMDRFRGASVGVVIQCEGGSVVVPDPTRAVAYDRSGKVLRNFTGVKSHFANFAAAMRSRKESDLVGPIGEGHVSTALSHLANISHRLGSRHRPDEIKEVLQGDAPLRESFDRMAGHLSNNGVDLSRTPATLGMPLRFDPRSERFIANSAADQLLTRSYRAPYVVPAIAVGA